MKYQTNREGYNNDFAREIVALSQMVDAFAYEMKMRLFEKAKEGFEGWDEPTWLPTEIVGRLQESLDKGNMVDVANFAMFRWNRDEPK